jgi:hypothetical protein
LFLSITAISFALLHVPHPLFRGIISLPGIDTLGDLARRIEDWKTRKNELRY